MKPYMGAARRLSEGGPEARTIHVLYMYYTCTILRYTNIYIYIYIYTHNRTSTGHSRSPGQRSTS